MKEAEANKLKLTPQFLELKFIEAISNNTKMFFGNKVIPFSLIDIEYTCFVVLSLYCKLQDN